MEAQPIPPNGQRPRVILMGAVTGLLAGLVVLAFRWLIFSGQVAFLPGGLPGNYEALDPGMRLALPVVGGIVLGWLFERLPAHSREVGVVYVLSRLGSVSGSLLSLRNFAVQFLFGAAAIVMGHSVDREGPGVHLGATCGSQLGARLGLTDRDRRTLIACGAAASIAAAFNTPLAGAIFAIEVMRFRYTIARFMPVILAAVIGAVVVRALRGPALALDAPGYGLQSMLELPAIALMGMATGAIAAAFIVTCQQFTLRFRGMRPLVAFAVAGLATGLMAQLVPQIMGVGTDTLEMLLTRQLAAPLLVGIVVFKLLATSMAVGCRVPGGLIGPTLVIGGAMGALAHFVFSQLFPVDIASPGFYSIIGMVAMMAAALRAPLAALIALLELTGRPAIILPGMLAVVGADLVARLWLRRESVFTTLLHTQARGDAGGGHIDRAD